MFTLDWMRLRARLLALLLLHCLIRSSTHLRIYSNVITIRNWCLSDTKFDLCIHICDKNEAKWPEMQNCQRDLRRPNNPKYSFHHLTETKSTEIFFFDCKMHFSDKKMDLSEHFLEGYLLILSSKLFKDYYFIWLLV
jgi:hypothetical protein